MERRLFLTKLGLGALTLSVAPKVVLKQGLVTEQADILGLDLDYCHYEEVHLHDMDLENLVYGDVLMLPTGDSYMVTKKEPGRAEAMSIRDGDLPLLVLHEGDKFFKTSNAVDYGKVV